LPAALPAALPLTARRERGSSICGAAAVTFGPFQDRPLPLIAEATRSASLMSTQGRSVRLSTRK
jgi:hypothetical protein